MRKICFLFPVLLFFSCTSEKEKTISRIEDLEKKLFDTANASFNTELAASAVAEYLKFTEQFLEDSVQCAEYLFRCADLQAALGEYRNAVSSLNRIYTSYPQFKKYPDCIFLQGYYYQEYLQDTSVAKQFYNELIAKYPSHPFADDAGQLLKMMGKSEKEMLEMIMKQAGSEQQ